jgi:putative endonuclease
MTNELERRIAEHNEGVDPQCYTFLRRPVTLRYVEEFRYVLDAIAREKQLKGWTRRKKEALMDAKHELLKEFAKGRHPSTASRSG